MAKQNTLRSEIQALRNQAKARGHKSFSDNQDIKDKAFVQAVGATGIHKYVAHDLLRSTIFLIIAVIILGIVSVKFSDFSQFDTLRHILHISRLSL